MSALSDALAAGEFPNVSVVAATVPPPAPRLIDTEPTRSPRDRAVHLEWEVSTDEDGNNRRLAALSVLSMHPQCKAYVATLHRVTVTRRGSITTRSMALLGGVRILEKRSARFSAKDLATFADEARTALVARRDDPAVMAAFGETDDTDR